MRFRSIKIKKKTLKTTTILIIITIALTTLVFTMNSENNKTVAYIELAQQRLDDLREIAAKNRVANLHPTIKEFEGQIEEASKSFAGLVEKEPRRALQAGKELVELGKAKSEVELVLGAQIGGVQESEFDERIRVLVEQELRFLEGRELSEEQTSLLKQAEVLYAEESYQDALEALWQLGQTE